jgi:hypothetical protein
LEENTKNYVNMALQTSHKLPAYDAVIEFITETLTRDKGSTTNDNTATWQRKFQEIKQDRNESDPDFA